MDAPVASHADSSHRWVRPEHTVGTCAIGVNLLSPPVPYRALLEGSTSYRLAIAVAPRMGTNCILRMSMKQSIHT